MNIELERKAIYVAILDRENEIQKVIFQDSSFFVNMSIEEAEKHNIKVTIYGIENNKKFLIVNNISLFELRDNQELRNNIFKMKKIKLEYATKNIPKMDLTNFKFNLNWSLIF